MGLNESYKIWNRLVAKRQDGSTLKLRFQALPLARLEDALEFIINNMLRDEACHRASGVYKNEQAVEEYRLVMTTIFSEEPPDVTMCCVDDDSEYGGLFVGMSTLMLMKKTESFSALMKQFPIETDEMKNLFKTAQLLEDSTEISKQFECHYHGAGIVVHPEYRGLGIAKELIRIRGLICEENKVPMTGAWMTAKGSQLAAERNNWITDAELKPETIAKYSNVSFDNYDIIYKHMYTTIA